MEADSTHWGLGGLLKKHWRVFCFKWGGNGHSSVQDEVIFQEAIASLIQAKEKKGGNKRRDVGTRSRNANFLNGES